jgi:DNA-binding NarL/FixJ family response regulator
VIAERRLAEHVARLERLPHLRRQLADCADASELFARGAELIRREGGFARAIVLTVDGEMLTAATSGVLLDLESDRMRRAVLEAPVPVQEGAEEWQTLQSVAGAATKPMPARSRLAERLALDHHAFAPVAPEGDALALLIVDRPDAALDVLDRAALGAYATILAGSLERIALDARMEQLVSELRHLTVTAQALMGETLHQPIRLTSRGGAPAELFPLAHGEGAWVHSGVAGVLSAREITIVDLLAQGMSNRAIAHELVLSPETVKAHVARILRKLDAANRVEAVTRYLRLTGRG